MFDFIYSDEYLNWQLGKGHPTNPIRAKKTLEMMKEVGLKFEVIHPRAASYAELVRAHDSEYVDRTLEGWNSEWGHTQRADMGRTARIMAGGTMRAAGMIMSGTSTRAFNPQGAKHHAEHATGGGFCVFNDFAMAARYFQAAADWKVAIIDWDVHQGNGTESILLEDENVLTASIHGVYFGGLRTHAPDNHAYNYQLAAGDGDLQWLNAIDWALDEIALFKPDVIMVATGADSHKEDPLGNLNVTVDGYTRAARMVRNVADSVCKGRMLVGGAGGYRPMDWTPACWTAVASQLV